MNSKPEPLTKERSMIGKGVWGYSNQEIENAINFYKKYESYSYLLEKDHPELHKEYLDEINIRYKPYNKWLLNFSFQSVFR